MARIILIALFLLTVGVLGTGDVAPQLLSNALNPDDNQILIAQ